jgi:hypothetical protein
MAAEHWLRWHHGTATDPKWRVVAARAGKALSRAVTVGHVLSVWALMLECASQSKPRGELSGWVDEDAAAALGYDEAEVAAIRDAMQGKTLDGDHLTGWERRQPKAEDSTAADRKRAQRERERSQPGAGRSSDSNGSHAASRSVTTETETETEEREATSSLRSDESTASRVDPASTPVDLSQRRAEKEQRLAQVTDDAVTAYNAVLGKPHGLLVAVSATIGRDKRQQQVKRCIVLARQIAAEKYRADRIPPELWADYFAECAADPFRNGTGPYAPPHENWRPDFEFLTRPAEMLKVFDRASSEDSAEVG